MGIGGISLWSVLLILFLLFLPLIYIPVMHKAGFSGLWVIVFYIPVLNVIMFWVFAFVKWPVEKA